MTGKELINSVMPINKPIAEKVNKKIQASGLKLDYKKNSEGIYLFRFNLILKHDDSLYLRISHEWTISVTRDINEINDFQELIFLFSSLIWQSFIFLNNISAIDYPISEDRIQKYVSAVLIANRN